MKRQRALGGAVTVIAAGIVLAAAAYGQTNAPAKPIGPRPEPHRPQPTQDASKGSSEDADDRLTRMNRELDKVLNSICRGC